VNDGGSWCSFWLLVAVNQSRPNFLTTSAGMRRWSRGKGKLRNIDGAGGGRGRENVG